MKFMAQEGTNRFNRQEVIRLPLQVLDLCDDRRQLMPLPEVDDITICIEGIAHRLMDLSDRCQVHTCEQKESD